MKQPTTYEEAVEAVEEEIAGYTYEISRESRRYASMLDQLHEETGRLVKSAAADFERITEGRHNTRWGSPAEASINSAINDMRALVFSVVRTQSKLDAAVQRLATLKEMHEMFPK